MLDANIPLSVKPIEVASPAQSIGHFMQLRGELSRIALQQAEVERAKQQTADFKAVADQRNRDLGDQKTFQYRLAANAGDWGATFSQLEKTGEIAPVNLQMFQNKHAETIKNVAQGSLEEINAHNAQLKTLGAGIGAILQLPKEQRPAEYAGWLSRIKADPQLAKGAAGLPESWSDDQAQALQWQGTASQQINEAALKQKEESRLQTAATDTHAKQVAELPGETAESDKKVLVTQAMKEALADPTKGAAAIDAALPPATDAEANRGYKAAWQAAMSAGSPEAAARIVEAAAQHATSLSPATRAAHVAQAVDTAKATAPVTIATDVAKERALTPLRIAAEVQKQVQLAKLSPDAFAGIVDPRTRMAAETQYEKDSKEYATKIGDAKRIQDFVAAAQSGNKAAPGLIPLTELRGLVNRVNRTELEAVGSGAGSLLDKISGKLGSITEGQPIPADILKDTAKIADVMQQGARRNYEYQIQVNNKTHGGKVTPIELGDMSAPPVTGTVAPITLKDGRTLRPHDQASADAFRKDHPELIK